MYILFNSNSGDIMELIWNSVAKHFFFQRPTSSISWNVLRNIKSIYRIALFDYKHWYDTAKMLSNAMHVKYI